MREGGEEEAALRLSSTRAGGPPVAAHSESS
jgi:hypothetical protein